MNKTTFIGLAVLASFGSAGGDMDYCVPRDKEPIMEESYQINPKPVEDYFNILKEQYKNKTC